MTLRLAGVTRDSVRVRVGVTSHCQTGPGGRITVTVTVTHWHWQAGIMIRVTDWHCCIMITDDDHMIGFESQSESAAAVTVTT